VKPAERLVDELERLFIAIVVAEPADLELTLTQRLALRALAGGEVLRLTDLARRIRVSDPTASRAVDGLVAHGLVERHVDPEDRRALRLAATVTGRKRVEQRRRAVAAALGAALDELEPRERTRLLELLGRLNASLPSYSNSVNDARIA
jgi:DNA-binding MarR family transcriptional regulator